MEAATIPDLVDDQKRLTRKKVFKLILCREGKEMLSCKLSGTGQDAQTLFEIFNLCCWPPGLNLDISNAE